VNITVTWIDGMQETYHCVTWHVREGFLALVARQPEPERRIPLASVRIWTVTD